MIPVSRNAILKTNENESPNNAIQNLICKLVERFKDMYIILEKIAEKDRELYRNLSHNLLELVEIIGSIKEDLHPNYIIKVYIFSLQLIIIRTKDDVNAFKEALHKLHLSFKDIASEELINLNLMNFFDTCYQIIVEDIKNNSELRSQQQVLAYFMSSCYEKFIDFINYEQSLQPGYESDYFNSLLITLAQYIDPIMDEDPTKVGHFYFCRVDVRKLLLHVQEEETDSTMVFKFLLRILQNKSITQSSAETEFNVMYLDEKLINRIVNWMDLLSRKRPAGYEQLDESEFALILHFILFNLPEKFGIRFCTAITFSQELQLIEHPFTEISKQTVAFLQDESGICITRWLDRVSMHGALYTASEANERVKFLASKIDSLLPTYREFCNLFSTVINMVHLTAAAMVQNGFYSEMDLCQSPLINFLKMVLKKLELNELEISFLKSCIVEPLNSELFSNASYPAYQIDNSYLGAINQHIASIEKVFPISIPEDISIIIGPQNLTLLMNDPTIDGYKKFISRLAKEIDFLFFTSSIDVVLHNRICYLSVVLELIRTLPPVLNSDPVFYEVLDGQTILGFELKNLILKSGDIGEDDPPRRHVFFLFLLGLHNRVIAQLAVLKNPDGLESVFLDLKKLTNSGMSSSEFLNVILSIYYSISIDSDPEVIIRLFKQQSEDKNWDSEYRNKLKSFLEVILFFNENKIAEEKKIKLYKQVISTFCSLLPDFLCLSELLATRKFNLIKSFNHLINGISGLQNKTQFYKSLNSQIEPLVLVFISHHRSMLPVKDEPQILFKGRLQAEIVQMSSILNSLEITEINNKLISIINAVSALPWESIELKKSRDEYINLIKKLFIQRSNVRLIRFKSEPLITMQNLAHDVQFLLQQNDTQELSRLLIGPSISLQEDIITLFISEFSSYYSELESINCDVLKRFLFLFQLGLQKLNVKNNPDHLIDLNRIKLFLDEKMHDDLVKTAIEPILNKITELQQSYLPLITNNNPSNPPKPKQSNQPKKSEPSSSCSSSSSSTAEQLDREKLRIAKFENDKLRKAEKRAEKRAAAEQLEKEKQIALAKLLEEQARLNKEKLEEIAKKAAREQEQLRLREEEEKRKADLRQKQEQVKGKWSTWAEEERQRQRKIEEARREEQQRKDDEQERKLAEERKIVEEQKKQEELRLRKEAEKLEQQHAQEEVAKLAELSTFKPINQPKGSEQNMVDSPLDSLDGTPPPQQQFERTAAIQSPNDLDKTENNKVEEPTVPPKSPRRWRIHPDLHMASVLGFFDKIPSPDLKISMITGGFVRDYLRRLPEPYYRQFSGKCPFSDIDTVTEYSSLEVAEAIHRINEGGIHTVKHIPVKDLYTILSPDNHLNRNIRKDISYNKNLQDIPQFINSKVADFRCNLLFIKKEGDQYYLIEGVEGGIEDARIGLLTPVSTDLFEHADILLRTAALLAKGCHMHLDVYNKFITQGRAAFLGAKQFEQYKYLEDLINKLKHDPLNELMLENLPRILCDIFYPSDLAFMGMKQDWLLKLDNLLKNRDLNDRGLIKQMLVEAGGQEHILHARTTSNLMFDPCPPNYIYPVPQDLRMNGLNPMIFRPYQPAPQVAVLQYPVINATPMYYADKINRYAFHAPQRMNTSPNNADAIIAPAQTIANSNDTTI